MSFEGWTTWVIYQPLPDNDMGFIAAFASRKKCREYLKYKKEQHFFENKDMEAAEKEWGEDNFIIDYSYNLTRSNLCYNFPGIELKSWNHD